MYFIKILLNDVGHANNVFNEKLIDIKILFKINEIIILNQVIRKGKS